MLVTPFLVLLAVCSSQSKPFFNDSQVYGPYPDPESIVKTVKLDSSDSAHQEEDGVKIWRFNIAAEGCGSARFNLKVFDMAKGDYIVVYGVDAHGQQTGVERYEGKGRREDGEVNSRRVWAKELVLEMHGSSPHSHFLLNYVHYADCFQERPGIPESICGTNDWKDIICYNAYSVITGLGPSVFRIRFVKNGGSYLCTGWKGSDNSRFVTNYHCLGTQTITSTAELDYKYDATSCGGSSGNAQAVYHGNTMIQTSGSTSLDFTIFTVTESTSSIACLRRTNTPPSPTTDYMMIVHHPSGYRKKVSLSSDQDTGGFCRRASSCSGRPNDYCYMCDTAGGSSGSPVFFWQWSSRMPVFALHHYGGCPNSGVKMSLVSTAAGSNLGACA